MLKLNFINNNINILAAHCFISSNDYHSFGGGKPIWFCVKGITDSYSGRYFNLKETYDMVEYHSSVRSIITSINIFSTYTYDY